eukprot:5088065-Prymnesium_polylepis.1
MSTVGYGDLSPSTPELKLFTIFMIYLGIVLVFSRVADLIDSFTTPLTDAGRAYLDRKFPPVGVDLDDSGDVDYYKPLPPVLYYFKNLLPSFILEWCAAPVAPVDACHERRAHSTPYGAPSRTHSRSLALPRSLSRRADGAAPRPLSSLPRFGVRQELPIHLRRHLRLARGVGLWRRDVPLHRHSHDCRV